MTNKRFKKILIVKPSSLGDIVHSLPFLNAIKKCFPDTQVHWVIAKGFHELLEGHPMIDRLWVVDKNQWKKITAAGRTIKELKELFKALKNERYDLVVDLQGLLRSGIMTKATGAKRRVGFKEAREGSTLFYTQKIAGGRVIHAVDRYLKVAASLGCDVSEVAFPMPETPYPIPFDEDYAVVAPGARWKTKRWPSAKFSRLVLKLPIRSIIVGSKSDSAVARQIAGESGGRAISVAGKTDLKELSSIIKNARFIVTNDSGPMHFAVAHGVPVFALFGPTDPARTGPYGGGHTIITSGAKCAPCLKKSCGDIKCMEKIPVKQVLNSILANLNASR